MGRKKNPTPAWKDWQTSLEEARRIAGVQIANRILDLIHKVDRRLTGKEEARTWREQLSKLRGAQHLLEDVDQDLHLRRSSIFLGETGAKTRRQTIEAALDNPLLNAIADRVLEGNEVLPAGTTPTSVKHQFQQNFKIATDAIGALERLSKAIGEPDLAAKRTGAIAASIVELERKNSIELTSSTVAYLDLAATEKTCNNEDSWTRLRQQWDVALRRARDLLSRDS